MEFPIVTFSNWLYEVIVSNFVSRKLLSKPFDSVILQKYQSRSNQSFKHNSAHMPSFSFEPTIIHKNSETCTTCLLIQCWLQVCLVLPGHHYSWHAFSELEQYWITGKGEFWVSLSKYKIFLGLFHKNIVNLNNFCDWLLFLHTIF